MELNIKELVQTVTALCDPGSQTGPTIPFQLSCLFTVQLLARINLLSPTELTSAAKAEHFEAKESFSKSVADTGKCRAKYRLRTAVSERKGPGR